MYRDCWLGGMGLLERKLSVCSRLDVEVRSHHSRDWRRVGREGQHREEEGAVSHACRVPAVDMLTVVSLVHVKQ